MSLADENDPIRVCFYGNPGSTKTTNLTSLAKRGKMYVVDADSGMKRRALEDFGIPAKNIEPFREITYSALEGMAWDLRAELDDDPDAAVGLGIDTATEAGQRLLSIIVDQKQGQKISKAEKQGLDSDEIDPFFRDRDYYGTLTEQFRRLLRQWKDLGLHLGITAHVRRDVDEDTRKVMYGPDVNPAIQNLIMGAVDVIAWCRIEGSWPEGYEVAGMKDMDVSVGVMRERESHHAKDRFHKTPRLMVNPTFDRIIDYIEGRLTVEKDEQQQAYIDLFRSRKAETDRIQKEKDERKRAAAAKKTSAARPATKTSAAKKAAATSESDEDDAGEGGDDAE